MNLKNVNLSMPNIGTIVRVIAAAVAFLVFFTVALVVTPTYKQPVLEKFDSFLNALPLVGKNTSDEYWANEILKGGYILHFRHAERDKWIDVQMYDSLESDVHANGDDQSRMAENDYFVDAVCLNKRGKVQAKAMGEHIARIGLPIGYVISSPSCRSRQTSDMTFGRQDRLERDLVHRGPYLQSDADHVEDMKKLYMSLPAESGKNTIVSAHNSVVHRDMFNNGTFMFAKLFLEEGGFYVISKTDDGLRLEHEFHNFLDFVRVFYKR